MTGYLLTSKINDGDVSPNAGSSKTNSADLTAQL
jgi:hypothetical protein